MSGLIEEMMVNDGRVESGMLAEKLRVTKVELANSIGLSKDSISKRTRIGSPKTQARLREIVEILNRITQWSGSTQAAYAWYRSQPIPSFGDRTAEDMLKAGQGEAVRRYLSRINDGGYA